MSWVPSPVSQRVQFTVKKIDSLEVSAETNISKDDALTLFRQAYFYRLKVQGGL